MARYLKHGRNPDTAAADDKQVRTVVETILADVQERGDAAVRELSIRFDGLDRADFRLTDQEIRDCLAELPARAIEDIKFAQAQVRNFAQHQRESMRDIEVETLPGVVLGHKNIPVNSVGCYVPGGKYPLLASAHMSVVTARVAGVQRVITCAPPFGGGRRPPSWPPSTWPARTRSCAWAACRRWPRWRSAPRASRGSTCWSGPATPTSPKPSGSCSAASASTCSPARPRRW